MIFEFACTGYFVQTKFGMLTRFLWCYRGYSAIVEDGPCCRDSHFARAIGHGNLLLGVV